MSFTAACVLLEFSSLCCKQDPHKEHSGQGSSGQDVCLFSEQKVGLHVKHCLQVRTIELMTRDLQLDCFIYSTAMPLAILYQGPLVILANHAFDLPARHHTVTVAPKVPCCYQLTKRQKHGKFLAFGSPFKRYCQLMVTQHKGQHCMVSDRS